MVIRFCRDATKAATARQGDTEEKNEDSQCGAAERSTTVSSKKRSRGSMGGGIRVIREANFKSGVTGVVWNNH